MVDTTYTRPRHVLVTLRVREDALNWVDRTAMELEITRSELMRQLMGYGMKHGRWEPLGGSGTDRV